MNDNTPKPPAGLGRHGRKLWADILRDWIVDTADGLEILEIACRCKDEMADAASLIRKHGLAVKTKTGGLKTNPAVAIERSARAALLRALAQLNLTDELPKKLGRPSTQI